MTTLDEYTSLPMFPVRLGTAILSSLGLVALLLAATGLYGVMAYRVAQRWRELALRMALGASRSEVFALVFRDGARQTVFGIVTGLVLSVGVLRLVAMRLPQLGMPDASVVATATGVLVAIAVAAALLPAVRAAKVDPATVLRGDPLQRVRRRRHRNDIRSATPRLARPATSCVRSGRPAMSC